MGNTVNMFLRPQEPSGALRGPSGGHEQYRITSQHQTTASNSREEEGEDAEQEEEEEEEEEGDDNEDD